jgi:hypothetical protein
MTDRLQEEVFAWIQFQKRLLELSKQLDGMLTQRPLRSVLVPTEHYDYEGMIRDILVRCYRELNPHVGDRPRAKLSVIDGGNRG